MQGVRPALTKRGSVLINMSPGKKDGKETDWVRRSVDALIDDGWILLKTFRWIKTGKLPSGKVADPRAICEEIYWFSMTTEPYLDVYANGLYSDRTFSGEAVRIAKIPDVFYSCVSELERRFGHPAMFPLSLCEQLIRTFSRLGDTVLDLFAGVASTGVAAIRLKRNFIGFEIEERFWSTGCARLRSEEIEMPVRLNSHLQTAQALHVYLRKKLKLRPNYVKLVKAIVRLTVWRSGGDPVRIIAVNQTELANAVNQSRRSVWRSLNRLAKAGIIVKQDRPGLCALIGLGRDFLDV